MGFPSGVHRECNSEQHGPRRSKLCVHLRVLGGGLADAVENPSTVQLYANGQPLAKQKASEIA